MPRCKSCGQLINSGQYCKVCNREWGYTQDGDVELESGPEYIQCEFCEGRSYIWKNGTKRDCPVCDGFGKVRIDRDIVVDGGTIDKDGDILIADDGGEIIDG